MFKIITIGQTPKEWQFIEKEYLKRISGFNKINLLILDSSKYQNKNKTITTENQKIINQISTNDFVIALDKTGKQTSSENLAKKINLWQTQHHNLLFVIGGAFGLDQQILSRANFILSLSELTLTHQIARIVLLEQIYRSLTILNNKTYHY